METKKERFIRIAESRTNKIIEMIRLLANCANKSNYDYDEKEINYIFSTLKRELNDAQEKFNSNNKKNKEFKLK